MRNHNKKFNPLKTVAFFLERMARCPLLVFLVLSAIGIGIAVWIFFVFQDPVETAIQAMPSAGPASFGKSDIDKYNEVFSVIKQREIDSGQAANTTYPNVFEPLRKKLPQ